MIGGKGDKDIRSRLKGRKGAARKFGSSLKSSMNFRKYVVQYGKTKEGGFNMPKVCPKCGREFENRSANCPICKCTLEEVGVKKTSAGSTAGTRAVQNVQARQAQSRAPQQSRATAPQTRSAYQEPQKEKPSGLSITALVFSLLGCLSIVGLVLGIVDLCVNKERKKVCSILALVFSGLWIVGIAAVIGGSDSPKTPQRANNSLSYSEGKSSGYDSGASVQESSSNDTFGLMETAQANNVKVTMTKYEESNGSEWNKPSSGNVFVLAEFEIENGSSSDLAISSVLSFESYVDGYATNYSLSAIMDKSGTQLDGTVAPGKKMKGWIGWEVPLDWKEVEIHFTDNVWIGSTFKFLINR